MLDIKYSLEINKNGETVNTFTGKGENALAEMVRALNFHINKKFNDNVYKTKIASDSVHNELKVTVTFDNGYTYVYTFSGEDLHKVYTL